MLHRPLPQMISMAPDKAENGGDDGGDGSGNWAAKVVMVEVVVPPVPAAPLDFDPVSGLWVQHPHRLRAITAPVVSCSFFVARTR